MSKTIDVTVGKHDSSISYLTTSDFRILEYPSALLPSDIKTGSVLQITIANNETLEKKQNDDFLSFQNNLLKNLSKYTTKPPVLTIKSKLQTSISLSWEKFDLGVSCLKNVTIWHKSLDPQSSEASDNEDEDVDEDELSQIATIYNLTSNTYKMSGLNIASKHAFQLRIDTSNGLYKSDVIVTSTLSSNDFSGFNICVGALSTRKISIDDINAVAEALKIEHVSRICTQDTTHFLTDVADDENEVSDQHLLMAKDLNIPIVTPNWLQGCLKENKLLGVKGFYYKLPKEDESNLVAKYPFEKEFTDKFLAKGNDETEAEVVEEAPKTETLKEESDTKVVVDEDVKEEPVKSLKETPKEQKDADPVEEETATDVVVPKPTLPAETIIEPPSTTEIIEEPSTENTPEITEAISNDEITATISAQTPSSVSLTPVSTTQSKKGKGKKKKNNKKK